jgi:hypothetical protein
MMMGEFACGSAVAGHSMNFAKLKIIAALIWYSLG